MNPPHGNDVGNAIIGAVAVMMLSIALALTVLFLDLRHRAAVEETGRPPAPFVQVVTPTTYGPPPW